MASVLCARLRRPRHGSMGASHPSGAESHSEALEEARIAVESIVLPRQQPIELMPRAEDVVEAQVWHQHGHGMLIGSNDRLI